MEGSLKHFVDSIFTINASFSNMFGSGIPGGSGTSAATTGGSSSASSIVNDLRYATGQFAEKVTAKAPKSEIDGLAKHIEGNLLSLQALEQISERFCNELIEELHSLI